MSRGHWFTAQLLEGYSARKKTRNNRQLLE